MGIPPPQGPPTPFLGTPPHSHQRLSLLRRRDASPPPLRPLSTFFFSIFNWKKKGGPRAISLLLGGARYARPPQQKEEGEASPPVGGGDARGGAAPPLSLRSSWVAAVLGGPHENPWRPPTGASKGARGGFASLGLRPRVGRGGDPQVVKRGGERKRGAAGAEAFFLSVWFVCS
nr:hypothetical protein [Morchella crassipes]